MNEDCQVVPGIPNSRMLGMVMIRHVNSAKIPIESSPLSFGNDAFAEGLIRLIQNDLYKWFSLYKIRLILFFAQAFAFQTYKNPKFNTCKVKTNAMQKLDAIEETA